jgi:chromosomal replication initiation ATPase DnaA
MKPREIMKKEIFNSYVIGIANTFGISQEELFSKSRKRELVDARQLLYYLCASRPMRISLIQECMVENGYETQHSPIIHGIESMKKKLKEDPDYRVVVHRLEEAVQV